VLREVAEYPNSFGPLGPGGERLDTGRYTLCVGTGKKWNTVQRQRFPLEEVDEVIAEVRVALRDRGRTQTQWEVGSSAPRGLVEALLERGIVRDKEPYAVANAVQWEAFEMPPEDIAENRELLPKLYRETPNVTHAVWLDGEIVCAGTSAPTEYGFLLYGGATVPRARGRGAYRALNRARWDDAVAHGTPALITQGGSMSRPILEKLGFERVGEVHMLLDVFE
jgi:hypothetical protein